MVKFFGRLFDGMNAFEVECEAAQLLSVDPLIATPCLLIRDNLFPQTSGWTWPYLVYEYIPGISLRKVYAQIPFNARQHLAREVAILSLRLHRLGLTGSRHFSPTWDYYLTFLSKQKLTATASHRMWHILPNRLVEQIDAYLPSVEELADCDSPPPLIHADLTQDHFIGHLEANQWIMKGLIDFGDAIAGDLFYELITLHLDLFQADKRLLCIYLENYGLNTFHQIDFPRKAMCTTLLHQFNVLPNSLQDPKTTAHVLTLDDLAARLWDINAPGLLDQDL